MQTGLPALEMAELACAKLFEGNCDLANGSDHVPHAGLMSISKAAIELRVAYQSKPCYLSSVRQDKVLVEAVEWLQLEPLHRRSALAFTNRVVSHCLGGEFLLVH